MVALCVFVTSQTIHIFMQSRFVMMLSTFLRLASPPFQRCRPLTHLKVTKESFGDNLTEIIIQFTKEGAQKFYLFTKENIRKPMAIVIAQQIVAMPTINDAIMGGKSNITGRFTDDKVDEIMARLKEKE